MLHEIKADLNVVFFLSARRGDLREFAVAVSGGKAAAPVYAFEPGRGGAGFRPGETVFALSESRPEGAEFPATLLHLETDGLCQPHPVGTADVRYRLFIRKENGEFSLRYRLTPQSVEKLNDEKFTGYPPEFTRDARGLDPALLENRRVDLRVLAGLPFPPHHPTARAEAARKGFASGAALLPAAPSGPADEDWEAPARIGLPGDLRADEASGIVVVQAIPAALARGPRN
jgi:hypothetical protein